MKLNCVYPEDLYKTWHSVLPFIRRVLDGSNGDYSVDYVLGCVVDGTYQLWVGYDGEEVSHVMITGIQYFESFDKTVCTIMHLAGHNMKDWHDTTLAQIESWAIDNGASELRVVGRPGWERDLKADGFRKTHTILAKPLGEKQ